ncbi:sn-glycerol-3-phosphate-binding lipoprotein ugpB, partial [Mycobacterium tuberculosis C]
MDPLNRRQFLALAAAAAGVTAGCAGMGGGGSVKSGSGPIDFWSSHPGQSSAAERELIGRFQDRFPTLSVKLIDAGKDYDEVAQKFNAALIGTDVPDVVLLDDRWWFHFALSGVLTALDDLFGQVGVDTTDYVDSLLADYEFNGRHYAVPYARSTPLFYYNKAAWQQAGLPDRGPQSWSEFDEWGPELQRVVGAGRSAHGWANADLISWTFQGPNWAFGGAYSDKWTLTLTEPATIAAGNFYRNSIHGKGYAAVANDIANEFATGILASAVASTGLAGRHHRICPIRLRRRTAAHGPGRSARLSDGRCGAGDTGQALRGAKSQRAQVHRIRHQPDEHRLLQPANRLSAGAQVRRRRCQRTALSGGQSPCAGGAR